MKIGIRSTPRVIARHLSVRPPSSPRPYHPPDGDPWVGWGWHTTGWQRICSGPTYVAVLALLRHRVGERSLHLTQILMAGAHPGTQALRKEQTLDAPLIAPVKRKRMAPSLTRLEQARQLLPFLSDPITMIDLVTLSGFSRRQVRRWLPAILAVGLVEQTRRKRDGFRMEFLYQRMDICD